MKIEIKLQISNKAMNSLARVMEPTLESIFRTETICFESQEPEKWTTYERMVDFEKKMNEDMNDGMLYKVESIAIAK